MNLKSFAFLGGLLALSACDSGDPMDKLAKKTWIAYDGNTEISLFFIPEEERAGGHIVNIYNIDYDINGDNITFSKKMITLMMGTPEDMKAEQDYMNFLETVNKYVLKRNTLILKNPEGKEYVFHPGESKTMRRTENGELFLDNIVSIGDGE